MESKAIAGAEGLQVERRILSVRLKGLSESTLANYRADVTAYLHFARKKSLAPGDVSTLKAYRQRLLKKGLRPASVNRKLVAIKRWLLAFARREYSAGRAEVLQGVYRDVKLIKVNGTEKQVSRDKLVTEGEAAALMAGMPERVRLIAEFLFQTGARISEALGARLSDVKNVNGYSEVLVIGKGQKARTLLVKTDLVDRARACYAGTEYLFETRNGTPYNPGYIYREFIRASLRVLGKQVSPHCARHSFATWTLERTRKVKGLSEYLGHSDVATTLALYVHEKLLVEELLGYPPGGRPGEKAGGRRPVAEAKK